MTSPEKNTKDVQDYNAAAATWTVTMHATPPEKPKRKPSREALKEHVKALKVEVADVARIAGDYLQSRAHWRARARVAEKELGIALDSLQEERKHTKDCFDLTNAHARERDAARATLKDFDEITAKLRAKVAALEDEIEGRKADAAKASELFVNDWVRVACEGHPAHGNCFRIASADSEACKDGVHYVLDGAPLAHTDGGQGGSPGFWCGPQWFVRVASQDSRDALKDRYATCAKLLEETQGDLAAARKALVERVNTDPPISTSTTLPLVVSEEGARLELHRLMLSGLKSPSAIMKEVKRIRDLLGGAP